MALGYLSLQQTKDRLLATGEYTQDTLPADEWLELTLEGIEIYLDEWLGYRAPLTDYDEQLKTNDRGIVLLPNYPVKEVMGLQMILSFIPGYDVPPVTTEQIHSIWRGERSLYVTNYLRLYYPNEVGFINFPVKVQYRAGLDPLPKLFELTVFQCLLHAVKNDTTPGDMSYLDLPTKDVSSISIPSISKSWQLGKATKDGEGGTVGDRLFRPLMRYRRVYLT